MPILSAYALCDHTLSTLTPSTSASSVSNDFISFTKQACSFVQVGLQSSGYHTSTTFFFPAKSDNFTSFLSWFGKAKSGAFCPTAMLMIVPPFISNPPASYPIYAPLDKCRRVPRHFHNRDLPRFFLAVAPGICKRQLAQGSLFCPVFREIDGVSVLPKIWRSRRTTTSGELTFRLRMWLRRAVFKPFLLCLLALHSAPGDGHGRRAASRPDDASARTGRQVPFSRRIRPVRPSLRFRPHSRRNRAPVLWL